MGVDAEMKDSECGKVEVVHSELGKRRNSATLDMEYVCDVCGMICTRQGSLTLHKRIHMPPPNQVPAVSVEAPVAAFACDQCGKKVQSLESLDLHVQEHAETEGKRFACEECGKSFVMESTLKAHTCSQFEKFTCHVCQKTFMGRLG